jgi:uncharacterized protein
VRWDRRALVLLPSAVLVLLTLVGWTLWPPPPAEPRWPWPLLLALGAAVGGLLLAGAALLERVNPSFRHASHRLERLVRELRLAPSAAVLVALVTGVVEELFFRGWLLHVLGLWGQALVFMLLHPAGRRAWAYTAYTGVAGVVFGLLTLQTGSILAAVVAHVTVNLHGFVSVSRGGPAPAGRPPERPPVP